MLVGVNTSPHTFFPNDIDSAQTFDLQSVWTLERRPTVPRDLISVRARAMSTAYSAINRVLEPARAMVNSLVKVSVHFIYEKKSTELIFFRSSSK